MGGGCLFALCFSWLRGVLGDSKVFKQLFTGFFQPVKSCRDAGFEPLLDDEAHASGEHHAKIASTEELSDSDDVSEP